MSTQYILEYYLTIKGNETYHKMDEPEKQYAL